jgi:predicted acetyltransferase
VPVEIRAIEPDEHDAFVRSVAVPFLEPVSAELVEAEALTHETDRCFVAVDGGRMVGNAAALTRTVTVPGPPGSPCPVVDLAAVTSVGVHPTHRRQGLLRRLMAALVDQARERGEALAGLWASEGGIYGRFGFGVATRGATIAFDPRRLRFAHPPPALDLRLVGPEEAAEALPALFEAARRWRPGQVDRRAGNWAVRLRDLRRGGQPLAHFVVAEGRGFACYRARAHGRGTGQRAALEVLDLLGVDAGSEAGLWAYVAGIDLVTEVGADGRLVDDPVAWRLEDPRAWRTTDVCDGLWLRLLDVPAALSARCYPAEGTLVLEVVGEPDPAVGRWRLDVGPDGADVRPARPGEDAGLRLGLADLGVLHLGGVAASTLAAAGRLVEERPGAVALADRVLASGEVPLNSTGF